MKFNRFICSLLIFTLIICVARSSDRSVWRSEFVECRYQRANITRVPEECFEKDKIFCCYNNAHAPDNGEDSQEKVEESIDRLDELHCCSFDEFLREHRTILNLISLLIWINGIIFMALIVSSLTLIFFCYNISEEDHKEFIGEMQNLSSLNDMSVNVKSKASQTLKDKVKAEIA